MDKNKQIENLRVTKNMLLATLEETKNRGNDVSLIQEEINRVDKEIYFYSTASDEDIFLMNTATNQSVSNFKELIEYEACCKRGDYIQKSMFIVTGLEWLFPNFLIRSLEFSQLNDNDGLLSLRISNTKDYCIVKLFQENEKELIGKEINVNFVDRIGKTIRTDSFTITGIHFIEKSYHINYSNDDILTTYIELNVNDYGITTQQKENNK